MYKIGVKLLGKNKTHEEFLSSGNWAERFMYTRAAHFTWEREFFKNSPANFWEEIKGKITPHYSEKIEVTDALVKLYLKSWVNYLQMRDSTAFGLRTGTSPVMPFDSTQLTKVFLSVPVEFRRKNNWNKQLIRDIMKPYVPDHLFSNPVRSLIVPYNELFEGHEADIFNYLKSSEILNDIFDLDAFEEKYSELPEGGLFMFHMMGIAVWYDVNFAVDNMKNFNKIFE